MANKDLRQALARLAAGDWQGAHQMEGDVANARYWYRRAGRVLRQPFSVEAEIAALQDTLRE